MNAIGVRWKVTGLSGADPFRVRLEFWFRAAVRRQREFSREMHIPGSVFHKKTERSCGKVHPFD